MLAFCCAPPSGEATQFLLDWLELSLPRPPKAATQTPAYQLGVLDPRLGGAIKDSLGVPCVSSKLSDELLRGCRLHLLHYLKSLSAADLHQSQLGLSHAYSRSKVKFNVHRVDNMIIQSSALLDQLDKDINTFAMRCREWYSWHFPELVAIVNDNILFAQCCGLIGDRSSLSPARLPELEAVLQDEQKAQAVLDAAKMSMGTDISPIDLINIEQFASRVVQLGLYRRQLHAYLTSKMNLCAPNLSALIGEQVGARLISHAGSLTNLAKYPASTVQILGAEKALFRALKTKSGQTPKYGLIYHSTFIGRAGVKNRGRISRYLANKCSLASRIDSFSDGIVSSVFGLALRGQVEDRLEFYKTGVVPKKNVDVMTEAVVRDREKRAEEEEEKEERSDADAETAKEKKKKKKKDKKRQPEQPAEEAEPAAQAAADEAMDVESEAAASEKGGKKKKDKKRRLEAVTEAVVAPPPADDRPAKKEKKDKSKKSGKAGNA